MLRLVHPRVIAPAERELHARFLAVAFAAPMLAPLVAATAPAADSAFMLATTCAALALGWGAALVAMILGRLGAAGVVLVLVSAAAIAAATVHAGAPASPLLLLLIAIPVETRWVARNAVATRLAALAALAAAIAALTAETQAETALSPLHWLAPLAWAGAMALRRKRPQAVDADAGREAAWLRAVDGALLEIAANGDIRSVSDGANTLLGLAPSLIRDKGLFDRIHVADRVDYLRALSQLRAGSARESLALRVRAPAAAPGDGSSYLDLELNSAADSGGVAGWLRAAREKAAPAAPAPASDSLEIAKARFLAAVSHELRTPLNAIIGFSDMMLHGLFGGFADPRQREYVALISESGGHLLNVVNAILDVSKIEAGTYAIRPEPFAFAEAVDMSRSMLARQAAAKNIVFENAVANDPEIVADRRAVQQILINLLSNAVKFTPDGGRVTIAAERRHGIFEFSVSDTGIGIAEADLARLGRPFTQIENDLTRSYDGAGLGLSLVKGLVELHRGSMSIESAPGEGTIVRIGLPDSGARAGWIEAAPVDAQEVTHEALRKYG